MNKAMLRLLVIFFVVLLGSGLLVYFVLDRTARNRSLGQAPAARTTPYTPDSAPTAQPPTDQSDSLMSELFGVNPSTATAPEHTDKGVIALRVLLRFLVAAALAALLAYRWRRGLSFTRRNPYVAQTQILLAVVAAAMMMIVGDSAARAFGIFAAASLVRFRTNIRDPKETTVLLICLGVGLAAGVGRLDMALILTIFVLLALWILEHFESSQVFRALQVSIGTRNVDQTLKVLKDLFARHSFDSELRQLDREGGESAGGKIVYELSLGTALSTDQLTAEILDKDAENIATLEWEQKKSTTYIYN